MKKWVIGLLFCVSAFVLAGCGQDLNNNRIDDGEITIGLSVADLTLERWQHDRDIFIETAEALGAKVVVQSADGHEGVQNNQVENLLTQGVDVIVIVPHNSDSIGAAAQQATDDGVPVIAYDRMINNAEIAAYISFDNVRVGEMQAQYIVDQVPTGNYFLMGGAPTDNNAYLFREGQMNVLQPLID